MGIYDLIGIQENDGFVLFFAKKVSRDLHAAGVIGTIFMMGVAKESHRFAPPSMKVLSSHSLFELRFARLEARCLDLPGLGAHTLLHIPDGNV